MVIPVIESNKKCKKYFFSQKIVIINFFGNHLFKMRKVWYEIKGLIQIIYVYISFMR